MRRVAVIGAGWAGLSAAVRLVQGGCTVEVFEAAPQAGGRARSVVLEQLEFDNGQHLIIGAYRATLALLKDVGVPEAMLSRSPLTLVGPGDFFCKAPRLPAPLHLLIAVLRARGLRAHDRWALIVWMLRQRWRGFAVPPGWTVAHWTAELPARVRQRLLDPLCLAALNTPAETADARVFAAVLRDSLTRARADSDFVFPQDTLGRLLPEHALQWLRRHHAVVHLRAPVHALMRDVGTLPTPCWRIAQSEKPFDAVVLAMPPAVTARCLEALADERLALVTAELRSFRYAPITTVYLLPESITMLHAPMQALECDPARGWYGQYVFDRSQTGGPWGWLAIVISDAGGVAALPRATLIDACCRQLSQLLGKSIAVAQAHVITDKRATYACTPGLPRPNNTLAVDGLFLAGDYTAGEYPATLEQAVVSGMRAAQAILNR